MLKDGFSLQIKAITWERDTHGLFDYESHSVSTKLMHVNDGAVIYREGDEVALTTDLARSSTDTEFLLAVEPSKRGFIVSSCESLGGEELWESLRDREHELADEDVVKIGRQQLQLRFHNKEDCISDTTNSEDSSQDSPRETCRICLCSEEGETDNPLLSPCHCAGSMKYIHYLCLNTWLQSKMVMRPFDDFQLFQWKAVECELCKQPLPRTISYAGRTLELCKAPTSPSVVIDCINKERSLNRALTIITMGDRAVVKIGRGHESEFRISDISVSRCHAALVKAGPRFTLRDLGSKFGTLLLVTGPRTVQVNCPMYFQVGRTFLMLEVRPGNYPVQPMFEPDSEDDTYPDENECYPIKLWFQTKPNRLASCVSKTLRKRLGQP